MEYSVFKIKIYHLKNSGASIFRVLFLPIRWIGSVIKTDICILQFSFVLLFLVCRLQNLPIFDLQQIFL